MRCGFLLLLFWGGFIWLVVWWGGRVGFGWGFFLFVWFVVLWGFFYGGSFYFVSILIYYSGAAEDCICISQSHNKKKKTLCFSDQICTLSDKTLHSSLSAAAFCHECQWRPGIQQYVCSNPKKCTIGGWHLVLSGSFVKYSLSLSNFCVWLMSYQDRH